MEEKVTAYSAFTIVLTKRALEQTAKAEKMKGQ
jgi:hypothetical protein